MRRIGPWLGIGLMGMLLAGCSTLGLSQRETRAQNYATYVYALYDRQEAQQTPAASTPPQAPLKMAVAQIGEVAPPQAMLAALQQEVGLVRTVQGIPGIFELERTDQGQPNRPTESASDIRQRASTQIQQMLRVARDLGTDYLFLYGGSVDYGARPTSWSLLDLTIVGGYVIPSQELKGTSRVSGALVDVASGCVVLLVSADAQRWTHVTTASLEGAQDRFVDGLREEAITKLTTQFVQRLRAVT